MSKFNEDEINLYIINRLSPDEKMKFEKEMQKDTELKKDVEVLLQIAEGLQYKRSFEAKTYIKNSVQNWREYVPELNEAKPSIIEKSKKGIRNIVNTISELAQQMFLPYPVAFRNPIIEQLSNEDQAFYYYNRSDFTKAIPFLLKLPKEDSEVQLMIGNAYLAQQAYELAYPYFKQLIEDNVVFFLSDTHWYAGLCLIGLNQLDASKNHFQYLINDENTSKELQQNAQTMLNKLTQHL